jgi:serine/threonine protein phosphatase PrpC
MDANKLSLPYLQYAARTFQGKKKPYKRINEDSLIAETVASDRVFVVADGNDLAHIYSNTLPEANISSMACQCFIKFYEENAQLSLDIKDRILRTLIQTIEEVCIKIEESTLLQYQATTLTAVVLSDNQYFAAHVGDSALIYYSRESEKVYYVTKSSQDGGDELFIQPSSKSLLLARLSLSSPNLGMHLYQGAAFAGDFFILTTDGLLNLWNELPNEMYFNRLLKIFAEQEKNPTEIMDQLFEPAYSIKAHDDLTCFIIKKE